MEVEDLKFEIWVSQERSFREWDRIILMFLGCIIGVERFARLENFAYLTFANTHKALLSEKNK